MPSRAPRGQLAELVPGLQKRFATYADYGRMTFDDLLIANERGGADRDAKNMVEVRNGSKKIDYYCW